MAIHYGFLEYAIYVLNPGILLNYNEALQTTIKYCYNVYNVNTFKIV